MDNFINGINEVRTIPDGFGLIGHETVHNLSPGDSTKTVPVIYICIKLGHDKLGKNMLTGVPTSHNYQITKFNMENITDYSMGSCDVHTASNLIDRDDLYDLTLNVEDLHLVLPDISLDIIKEVRTYFLQKISKSYMEKKSVVP